ncbi:glycosyltransferase family 4 protein [Hymenobacter weizhouensis]|uniref:glycosyltransferase family 4 protein n=1 Tax=Hymenobacter sp. YIM 151500-1 TaxID=2987689 RepID=UPI0022265B58|nr:glycosyltransferase family 4 protein [Hymenobacter sp. YIM 151500-1]UYZ61364.1 glycosyltransferase family 4 protein [Hymenobacter sp. YIM 151500-1]
MNILILNDTFTVGGAEIFSARLAEALLANGNNVWLYSVHNSKHIDSKMLQHNAPNVPVISLHTRFDWWVEKADSLSRRLDVDFKMREFLVTSHLKKFIQEHDIEVVHAHMFVSDYLAATVKHTGAKFARVASMHGTHEGFLYNYIHNTGWIIPNYVEKLNKCLDGLDSIIYSTDRNIAFLKEPIINKYLSDHIITERIYNGFTQHAVRHTITRSSLGIQDSDIVFGFAARGVPAKGWPVVLEAFKKISSTGAHLILIGDSPYVQELKAEYSQHSNIHFVGFQIELNEWIAITNVGLLPSTFGESLPTVIMEFLAQSKPMIVSDVAECANMIETEGEYAGYVINVPKNIDGFVDEKYRIDVNELAHYMQSYITSSNTLASHSSLALKAFQKFSMQTCVDLHLKVYKQAIAHSMTTHQHDKSVLETF